MGKLLSLLARDESTCCSPQKYDVFLDFENAQPTDSEKETFEEVQRVLKNSEWILEEIQCYKGAGKEIREAIANPAEEYQQKAWSAVLPLVSRLKCFYSFSTELEAVVPKILFQLCSGPMAPTQHLETQQALVKQFAEILEFVLKFDEHKMKTPAIQNDFSYYRRTLMRYRMSSLTKLSSDGDDDDDDPLKNDCEVSNELANHMSLFYANATPMLRVLSEATTRFVSENSDIPIENTTETLSTMAKVCLRMLESPNIISQFQREETQLFVLRVMVGLVILYDHVHPNGAFVKAANVDVKGCVRLLKDQPAARSEGLLNALRYLMAGIGELCGLPMSKERGAPIRDHAVMIWVLLATTAIFVFSALLLGPIGVAASREHSYGRRSMEHSDHHSIISDHLPPWKHTQLVGTPRSTSMKTLHQRI